MFSFVILENKKTMKNIVSWIKMYVYNGREVYNRHNDGIEVSKALVSS